MVADKIKLIACKVFKMSLDRIVAASDREIDVDYLPQETHNESDELRRQLTEAVGEAEESGEYKAILLAYGLCGNSAQGVGSSTVPLVIPRAHDCCTLFLGSRERFTEHFSDNPSRPFSSPGYAAEGKDVIHESTMSDVMLGGGRSWEELVEQYGEENARYVREMLEVEVPGKDRIVYIRDPDGNPPELEERARLQAEEEGLEFLPLEGNNRLLEKLVNGPWDDEFLVVPPGSRIEAVYDWEEILKAEKS